MSSAPASVAESTVSKSRPPEGHGWALWFWVAFACFLLGTSGVVRTVQAQRHKLEREYKETCPIDLTKIPAKLGDWHLVEGTDRPLDPLTMRITGGTAHLVRTYANDLTGVSVMVLILFGPAEPVLPHTPAVCYPSSGFSPGDFDAVRTINFPNGKDDQGRMIEGQAVFQAASFFKPSGRMVLREAVYHSFRLGGEWSPFVGTGRKFQRRNPGVFKIQIQRQVADGESLGQGDPIEQFLAALLAEIESGIKSSASSELAAR